MRQYRCITSSKPQGLVGMLLPVMGMVRVFDSW